MHHFFAIAMVGDTMTLIAQDMFQIQTVLRLKPGEQIVCIYQNQQYRCVIENDRSTKVIRAVECLTVNRELLVDITLAMGLVRSVKWDFILQKATELGVSRIVPVQFSRCVVQLERQKYESKHERWTKICKEASEQSRRSKIPTVLPVVTCLADLRSYVSEINLVAYENESPSSKLLNCLSERPFKSVTIVIGPEGGIDESELRVLGEIGYNRVSLGDAILRAETAALFCLSIIKGYSEWR